ncbi:hypothetical protein [Faecalicoccus pleomorphus]|uniref:hypothetical protein n=1 Tax=Faecalicoccus pleomorphus TaxID=1323 RepID=UPI001896E058|nr:hypothetical protein [Faecalicoccus pleomorphus]MDB7984914.1 hypothetical protein [Faecalicoccus pleomorphus]MDB7989308.1 hypothetical protein [Faecalicoccus pleomorphus]MDB7993631.1 hypothetical protein [Faecalicoccus pleomorphus]
MLGLRLKYDLKALFRVTWPVYVVSMVLPIGTRIFYWIQDWPIFDTVLFKAFSGFYTVIYVMSLFCLIIWPIVVCVRDFFNSMLKDEGYLTNTLPVSRNTLIVSKEIAGLILFLISIVLFILSLFVVIPAFDFMQLTTWLTHFHWTWREVVGAVLFILLALTSVYGSITMFVLAMMLGQMHRNAKGILSVAYYFVISFVMQAIVFVFLMMFGLAADTEIGWHIGNSFLTFASRHEWETMLIVFAVSILYNLTVGVIFHSISVWISNHKLNLE